MAIGDQPFHDSIGNNMNKNYKTKPVELPLTTDKEYVLVDADGYLACHSANAGLNEKYNLTKPFRLRRINGAGGGHIRYNASYAVIAEEEAHHFAEVVRSNDELECAEIGIDTNNEYHTAKHDQGKPRCELLPPKAILEMAKVMGFGAEKYSADSWKTVPDACERYRAALLRHALAVQSGETHDPETGLHHMAHVMCNAAFIIELEMEKNK